MGSSILTPHASRITCHASHITLHASPAMLCLLYLLRATLLTWKTGEFYVSGASQFRSMEIAAYKPNTASPALERIRSRTLQMNPELIARVADIIEGVRAGGDE